MGRDASYDPVQPESSISEEESLVLRSLAERGIRKGEELLDSVLERGLPNGPSLLRKLVDKGLLSADTDEGTPHDLTDLQIYDTPFRLAKEPSQPGRPSAPTIFSVDTVDSDPTDSFPWPF